MRLARVTNDGSVLSRNTRGNAQVRRCRSCESDLVRPATPGRHDVICPQCGERWLVVVVGDRMILAGLTEDQVDRALGQGRWGCLFMFLVVLAATVHSCMTH